MLSEQHRQKIEELKKGYQHPQSVVLAALWMWQEEHGWVSEEGMTTIAGILGIPPHIRSRCAPMSPACSGIATGS
jgi:NADH:ubiquinone oxidoreductase subunit E